MTLKQRYTLLINLGIFTLGRKPYAFGGFPKQPIVNMTKILKDRPPIIKEWADSLNNDRAQILDYVNRLITWKSDRSAHRLFDYWQTGQETLKRGTGDCEDKAILTYDLLREAGTSADDLKAICIKGHGFCAYKDQDGTWPSADGTVYTEADILIQWNENGLTK